MARPSAALAGGEPAGSGGRAARRWGRQRARRLLRGLGSPGSHVSLSLSLALAPPSPSRRPLHPQEALPLFETQIRELEREFFFNV